MGGGRYSTILVLYTKYMRKLGGDALVSGMYIVLRDGLGWIDNWEML